MNPFTRFLRSRLGREPKELRAFVEHWDRLEALIINVYKSGAADAETEAAHSALRAWLIAHYPRFEPLLVPYWRDAREAGAETSSDPFARLLAPTSAAEFIRNRAALQALPPAREALNSYLLTLV